MTWNSVAKRGLAAVAGLSLGALALPAHAQADAPGAVSGSYDEQSLSDLSNWLSKEAPASTTPPDSTSGEDSDLPGLAEVPRALADLPSGGGSVSPQAVALPTGPSSVLGMGESFTTQLSTGIVNFSIPLNLLTARGGVQPKLDLAYSSAAGFGLLGKGWSLGASAISRQTDRGIPSYRDAVDWYLEDRFVFGGMELVPICEVSGTACAQAPGELLPPWASGWRYFRARVEGGFLRFFWSPDRQTWRVQSKDGGNFELGVPLDGSGYKGALESNPNEPSQIFRWYIVRQYDSEGGVNASATPLPVNSVVYRYMKNGEAAYLTDIFDTSPAATPTTTNLSQFAHHVRVRYEDRPDVVQSYRAGWLVEYRLRATGVDVASKPFTGSVSAPRELVRRYHFAYEDGAHTSLLVSLETEGRCSSTVAELVDQSLPATQCPRLPPMALEYQRASTAAEPLLDADGNAFEPFDGTVRELDESPNHSLDEELTGLIDANADGLPDVVVTAPGLYGGKHAAFLNGATSQANKQGFGGVTYLPVEPLDGIDADVLKLNNPNVAVLDLDGDGLVNLVHMARAKKYTVFGLNKTATGWAWQGTEVATASQQDPELDFSRDARDVRVMDVNGDGLVDLVHSLPTSLRTFLSLGRYPGGHGQFGQARWTSATSAAIDNSPVAACAPWSGATVRFSDADVQVADMNGDGLPDIARVRSGQILYWPGRGNGFWGTGSRTGCGEGELAADRHVEMVNAPRFGVTRAGSLLVNDVNGDGLSDIVEVRSQGVDIYLNENGKGWTQRHIIDGTPFLPSTGNYARLADIDGSGTPDIVWGRAGEYRYIDLYGGRVPHLLVKTRNNGGATTELEYATIPQVMRQALAAGTPWASTTPTVSPVLVRSTVRDNLHLVARPGGAQVTEYSYRDPVYEPRQREFRGFREAIVRTLGDSNSPTSLQRSVFLLGECVEGAPADTCGASLAWQDNWREALKGLPSLSETFDESGAYLSSEHTTYELRQVLTGLDGRRVTISYPVTKDSFVYDASAFVPAETSISMESVRVNLLGFTDTEHIPVIRRATSGTARVRTRSEYDNVGNVTRAIKEGCVEGCPAGVDEHIIAESTFALPSGDVSGWLFRQTTSRILGSVQTAPRNEYAHTYNAQGKLLESKATLSGTLALDRFHSTGGTIAPAPPEASGGVAAPVQITVLTNTYGGAFGHVTSAQGSNGRCSAVAFDTLYEALPTSATAYMGGCGIGALTHTVAYDRGLEAVLTSTDTTSQPSAFAYDGFGRLISATSPNPAAPGTLAPHPSLIVEYFLSPDPEVNPYSTTITRILDGPDFSTSSYVEAWTFTDGLGRDIASLQQADPTAGDGGQWTVGIVPDLNAKGGVMRAHDPWYYTGSPESFSLASTPPSGDACAPRGSTYREYDAFGRVVRTYARDNMLDTSVLHHSLWQDIFDRADVEAGPHQNTPVTVVTDGHGRGVLRAQRIKVGAVVEDRYTVNEYLPTGEVRRVIQSRAGSPDVVRWVRYDSLGRMVLNVEPNTSTGFNPDPATPPSSIKAYRYAYNDAGDMVGFSDARGCGANYHYDKGGRLLAEDRSPCIGGQHAAYTVPNLTNGNNTEAFYKYDVVDTATVTDAAGQSITIVAPYLKGRVSSVSGLGSKAVFQYDSLGRVTGTGIKIVKPGAPAAALTSRYAPRWYVRTQTYDALDRVRSGTTGVPSNVPELLGTDGASQVALTYSKSGRVRSIAGSYGTLLASATYLADGRAAGVTFGDAAATQRASCHDVNGRATSVTTYRAAPSLWTSPPGGSPYSVPGSGDYTTPLLLEDTDFGYDSVGNITSLTDYRTTSEWPGGAKPVSRTFEYDDLYRLKKTTYAYPGGGDTWTSPYADELATPTRTPQPSPHVSFTNRIQEQEYSYDWLGNLQQTTDDQDAFWDRSIGDTTVGTATLGPNRVLSASNRTLAPASTRKGDVSVAYDASGNASGLITRRDGPCLPSTASCWQRFHYEWDEVGALTRARRWDLTTAEKTSSANDLTAAVPARTPNAELKYTYDASGSRTLKQATVAGATTYTVSIFGSLELRGTSWVTSPTPADFAFDWTKIQLLLPAGAARARVVHAQESLPMLTSGQQHVFLELADHLGSSSFIIDRSTGELVEFATYQSYGASESDFRPARWAEFREPLRFSGKEEDIEVGLAYFGARYYSPYLGLWLSPDPVTIHDMGSDMNPYAYVYGRPIVAVDPDGREPILAAVLIGAAIAASASIVYQAATVGFRNINWGMDGVLGAAVAGAVGGAVGAGVGAALGPSSGVTSSLAKGAVTGLYSSTASAATTVAITGRTSGMGAAMASGAVGGAVGGALAGVGKVASAVASAHAGSVMSGAMGGGVTAGGYFLSMGGGVAGALLAPGSTSAKKEAGGAASPAVAQDADRPVPCGTSGTTCGDEMDYLRSRDNVDNVRRALKFYRSRAPDYAGRVEEATSRGGDEYAQGYSVPTRGTGNIETSPIINAGPRGGDFPAAPPGRRWFQLNHTHPRNTTDTIDGRSYSEFSLTDIQNANQFGYQVYMMNDAVTYTVIKVYVPATRTIYDLTGVYHSARHSRGR